MDVKEEEALGQILEDHWYYRAKGLALDAMLGPRRFSTVLDIGAGSGIFAKRLLRRGVSSAICVDPAYREEYDAFIAGRPITFARQIRGRKADLVLLMDVLEHVDDDVGLVRHALEGAAERAHVLITVPAFQGLYSSHDAFLGHKRRYRLTQLEQVVRGAGLEVISARYFFALLLPLAALSRMAKRRSEPKSDLRRHSPPANAVAFWFHWLEMPLFRVNRFGGLSIFCLACRP